MATFEFDLKLWVPNIRDEADRGNPRAKKILDFLLDLTVEPSRREVALRDWINNEGLHRREQ